MHHGLGGMDAPGNGAGRPAPFPRRSVPKHKLLSANSDAEFIEPD